MFTASNIHYELADRVRAVGPGGIGAVHLLARRTGLTGMLSGAGDRPRRSPATVEIAW
jgi:hypothetical protein